MERGFLRLLLILCIGGQLGAAQEPLIELSTRGAGGIGLHVKASGTTNVLVEIGRELSELEPVFNIYSQSPVWQWKWVGSSITTRAEDRRFYRAVTPGQSLEIALNQWRAAGITNYQYTFERSCFCDWPRLRGVVTVRDGQIVSVVDVRADDFVVENPDYSEFKTIEELFSVIQERTAGGALVGLVFDSSLHYPGVVEIDNVVEAIDDERSYSIKNLIRLD